MGDFPPDHVAKYFISSSHRPSTILPFFSSSHIYSFPLLSYSIQSQVFLETWVKATKKYVFIRTHQGLFSSFIYFHSPSSACCGQKTKSDSFILLRLGNYNLVITRTQLGLQHSFTNQVNSLSLCLISLCPDKTSSLQNRSRLRRNRKHKKKKATMQYWVG